MDYFVGCSKCGEVIVKDNGFETKIRNRVLLVKSNAVYAVCKGCGEENLVPLMTDHSLMKSIRSNPKLFINKRSYKT